MRRALLAAVLLIGAAAAQTFTLGLASDPCTGGMAYPQPPGSMVSPIPTLRFSLNSPATGGMLPFSCSFTAAAGAGQYLVELDFVEPAAFVPSADPLGRAFSVSLTDAWGAQAFGSMSNVDLFTMGAASSAVVIARSFLVFSADGKIKVTLTPLKRSAVISRVVITPYNPAPDLSGYVPYKGATQDVNLGAHGLFGSFFDSLASGPTRLSLVKGACPAAADSGTDATLCLDVDGKLYQVSATGAKTPAGQ